MLTLENAVGYLGQTAEIRQGLDAAEAAFEQAKSMMRGEVEGVTLHDVMPKLMEAATILKAVEGALTDAGLIRSDQSLYHEFSEMRDAVLNQSRAVDNQAKYYTPTGLRGVKPERDVISSLLDNPRARVLETLDRAEYFRKTGAQPSVGYIDYNPELPPGEVESYRYQELDTKIHINPSRSISEELARIGALVVEDPRIEVFANFMRTHSEVKSLLDLARGRWGEYPGHHQQAFPKTPSERDLFVVKGVTTKPLAPAAIRNVAPKVVTPKIVAPKVRPAMKGLGQVEDPRSWPETVAFTEAAISAGTRDPEAMEEVLVITGSIGNVLTDTSVSDQDKKDLLIAATAIMDGLSSNTWAWIAVGVIGLVVAGGVAVYFLRKR